MTIRRYWAPSGSVSRTCSRIFRSAAWSGDLELSDQVAVRLVRPLGAGDPDEPDHAVLARDLPGAGALAVGKDHDHVRRNALRRDADVTSQVALVDVDGGEQGRRARIGRIGRRAPERIESGASPERGQQRVHEGRGHEQAGWFRWTADLARAHGRRADRARDRRDPGRRAAEAHRPAALRRPPSSCTRGLRHRGTTGAREAAPGRPRRG